MKREEKKGRRKEDRGEVRRREEKGRRWDFVEWELERWRENLEKREEKSEEESEVVTVEGEKDKSTEWGKSKNKISW